MNDSFSLAKQQQKKEEKALKKSKSIYRGKIIHLRKEMLLLNGKKPTTREYVEHPGSVGIVAIDNSKKMLFIRQYRKATKEILLEIPAGCLEKGEDPKGCAMRELQEETGYKAKRLIPLGGFFASPGFCDEYLHLFIALDLKKSPLPCDIDEAIDLVPMSEKEFLCLLEEGKVRDAKTIAAIFLYLQWKKAKTSNRV
jgi:ADP-ribose pyrophosphatase